MQVPGRDLWSAAPRKRGRMLDEDLRERLVQEFIQLASVNCYPGLSEFYLWDVLEEKRKPNYILGPLSEEALDILRLLRDDGEVWLKWNGIAWELIPISVWRALTEKKTSFDVSRELNAGTT